MLIGQIKAVLTSIGVFLMVVFGAYNWGRKKGKEEEIVDQSSKSLSTIDEIINFKKKNEITDINSADTYLHGVQHEQGNDNHKK